jgi:ketosteroid isomerase-like protein
MRHAALGIGVALILAACGSAPDGACPMSIAPPTVIAFLNEFEALAEKEEFSLIENMIDENAFFRFNDGDFVGRPAIRAAFEKTWRGDPTITKARFYLTDIVVLAVDQCSAAATYTYNWEGAQGDLTFSVRGRGTRVLLCGPDGFRIVHEHLSRYPQP